VPRRGRVPTTGWRRPAASLRNPGPNAKAGGLSRRLRVDHVFRQAWSTAPVALTETLSHKLGKHPSPLRAPSPNFYEIWGGNVSVKNIVTDLKINSGGERNGGGRQCKLNFKIPCTPSRFFSPIFVFQNGGGRRGSSTTGWRRLAHVLCSITSPGWRPCNPESSISRRFP